MIRGSKTCRIEEKVLFILKLIGRPIMGRSLINKKKVSQKLEEAEKSDDDNKYLKGDFDMR